MSFLVECRCVDAVAIDAVVALLQMLTYFFKFFSCVRWASGVVIRGPVDKGFLVVFQVLQVVTDLSFSENI